jgi:hypothetical protein
MLAQLFAHYAPTNFEIDLIYRSGRRFAMATDGTVVRDDPTSVHVVDWPKWVLFYFWPFAAASDGLWISPGVWDDGGVWDSTLTPEEVTDLRVVPREWNAAHCSGQIVLFTGTVELWDYPIGIWSDAGIWGGVSDLPPVISIE